MMKSTTLMLLYVRDLCVIVAHQGVLKPPVVLTAAFAELVFMAAMGLVRRALQVTKSKAGI